MKRHTIFNENLYSSWTYDIDDFVRMIKSWKSKAKKDGYIELKLEIREFYEYDTCYTEMILTGVKKKKI